MKFQVLIAAAAAAVAFAGAAHASTVNYNFDAPGFWSGSVSLDVTGGVASSGTGVINVPGYAAQSLTLIIPSDSGYESPPGFRANDGTDWVFINQNVPIDTDGLLFSVGNTTPTFGGQPIFPLYSDGAGGFDSGMFGHINGGPEFYEYNVATTLTAGAVPEPAAWAMMILGMGLLGVAARRRARALPA